MIKVQLNDVKGAGIFCKVNEGTGKSVSARQGRYIVDGKSILGILSFSLNLPISVELENATEEEKSAYSKALIEAGLTVC